MQEMWNKIFSQELLFWMRKQTEDTEDFNTVSIFMGYVKERIDYKKIVVLATQWHSLSEEQQMNVAIDFAGVIHASRFMLLMDYLSERFLEGRLR